MHSDNIELRCSILNNRIRGNVEGRLRSNCYLQALATKLSTISKFLQVVIRHHSGEDPLRDVEHLQCTSLAHRLAVAIRKLAP
jgi:hypothetical protein